MSRKKPTSDDQDTIIELKQLALRDDPDAQKYRDLHYQLVLNGLLATRQRIASGETTKVLSNAAFKRVQNEHGQLHAAICQRYHIHGMDGDDPCTTKRERWLDTLRIVTEETPKVETNWKTSFFSPRVRIHIAPKDAVVSRSRSRIIYTLPPLPDSPAPNPPMLSFHLDLSQVKSGNLAPWVDKFKQVLKQCLDEVPQSQKKAASLRSQNIQRDYERYRLHWDGMPFRWIAYLERMGQRPSGPIHTTVPGESSVRESVERVHLALFNRKYSARRHKMELRQPALEQACRTFRCTLHSGECPSTCPNIHALMKQIDALHPV